VTFGFIDRRSIQLSYGFDYSGNLASSRPDPRRVSRRHPVVIGGFGDTDCNSDYSAKLMRFADRVGISYLAQGRPSAWSQRPILRATLALPGAPCASPIRLWGSMRSSTRRHRDPRR
jgi:hypothetical protein